MSDRYIFVPLACKLQSHLWSCLIGRSRPKFALTIRPLKVNRLENCLQRGVRGYEPKFFYFLYTFKYYTTTVNTSRLVTSTFVEPENMVTLHIFNHRFHHPPWCKDIAIFYNLFFFLIVNIYHQKKIFFCFFGTYKRSSITPLSLKTLLLM